MRCKCMYVNAGLPLAGGLIKQSRQPQPLIGPYVCNAFADLSVYTVHSAAAAILNLDS